VAQVRRAALCYRRDAMLAPARDPR